MPGAGSLNIRLRLALVCALFSVPLVLALFLYGRLVLGEIAFNTRELHDVGRLRADWVSIDGPSGVGEIRQALGRALILDDHTETYRLAEALNSGLLELSVGEPRMRTADDAADSLAIAAASLAPGGTRARLLARADEVRGSTRAPQQLSRVQARLWWTDTLSDLGQLLEVRRGRIVQRVSLEIAFVAIFSIAACIVAASTARSLSRRANALVAEIDRLIMHDTEGVTPFMGDDHEIGHIAKGVEALRRALIEARGAWSEVLLNEMRYSLLAENMRDVVLLTDLQGQIVFASPSTTMFGREPQDLEATSIWALFDVSEASELQRTLAQAPEQPIVRRAWRPAGSADEALRWDLTLRRAPDQDENLLFVLSPAG